MARAKKNVTATAEETAKKQNDLLASEPVAKNDVEVNASTSTVTDEVAPNAVETDNVVKTDNSQDETHQPNDVQDDIQEDDKVETDSESVEPTAEKVEPTQPIAHDKVVVKILNKGQARYEPYIQQTIPHGESVITLDNEQQKQFLISNLMQINLLFGRNQFVVE